MSSLIDTMAMSDGDPKLLAADAAYASAERTVEAVDEAAATNDDPEVAEILDEAAIKADTTVNRVGWPREFVRRTMHRIGSRDPV